MQQQKEKKMNFKELSYFLLPALLVSCVSKPKVIPRKPEPEIITKKINLSDKTNLLKVDYARSKEFTANIKEITRIAISYNLPKDSSYTNEDIKTTSWHKEIEKSLIRMGLVINVEKEKANFLLDDEDEKTLKPDATLIIERVALKQVTVKHNFEIDDLADGKSSHPYRYYIAEINGKIVMKNNDILWTSSVVASSFDIFESKKRKKPLINIKGTREYRYSEKLNKWLKDKWFINTNDNFQSEYADNISDDFHKRELVKFVISGFINTIIGNG